MLTECAWAATRTKGTYYKSKYESLVGRRGKKKALIAVGRKMLIVIYHMLKDQQDYQELGGDYLDKLSKDKQIARHLRKLRELGVDVTAA